MPVLPLVGSTSTVSGPIRPSRSAASIIDTPIRSLTLEAGLNISSLATTPATHPALTRFNRTKGVPPTSPVTSFATRIAPHLPSDLRDVDPPAVPRGELDPGPFVEQLPLGGGRGD